MKKVFLFVPIFLWPFISIVADNLPGDSLNNIPLQEVEVVSVRATEKTPVSYSNLDKSVIESTNFGRDIPFLLLLTPSVSATSDAGTGIGYTGFRIRGTDANRINVTVNNIPLNDSESQGVFWVNMPDFASSLEDLQIQRGVGTSTNGAGAFGASVNLRTEHLSLKSYGEFNGSYGSFNTSKVTFKTGSGVIGQHWAFDARLSSLRSDGFINRATADLKSYFAQGAYFNDKTQIKFITFGGKEKTYHAWDGVPDFILFPSDPSLKANRRYNPSGAMGIDAYGNLLYYPNQTDNYEQTHYQFSLLQVLNPHLNLNATLHYTKGLGYYEEYKKDRVLNEYGLKPFELTTGTVGNSDLVRQQWLDNGFGGGVFSLDYRKDQWNLSLGGGANHYAGDHWGEVLWLKNYAGDSAFNPGQEYYRSKGEKSDFNVYFKGNYQLVKELSLYVDWQFRRIDYNTQGKNDTWDESAGAMQNLSIHEKFNFSNPKAGLYFQLNKENKGYGSVAVAHREPSRNNYTNAGINEIPHPERLVDYELGYQFSNKRFTVGVNGYYMRYKDQLVLNGRVNDIGEPLTSNVPDSYRAGIEWTAAFRILPCLNWNGNLTLSRNKIKNYTEYVTVYGSDGLPEAEQKADYYGTATIAFSPGEIANSLFTFQHRAFTVAFHSNYVGKQFLDNTGRTDMNQESSRKKERSLDAYCVNNLRLGYDFRLKGFRQLSFGLLINNLFNEQYETNGWVWSCYNRQPSGGLEPYTEKSYFPQAGIHAIANICCRF